MKKLIFVTLVVFIISVIFFLILNNRNVVTIIGTPVNIYGPYLRNYVKRDNQWELKDSTCLFIDDARLGDVFYKYSTNDMSSTTKIKVSGIVEKRVLNYGACDGIKAQCGKHLQYCVKVRRLKC
jgi:hypothetical protein